MVAPVTTYDFLYITTDGATALGIDAAGDTLAIGPGIPVGGYPSLLSAGNQIQPNFVSWVRTLCEPMLTNSTLLATLPAKFDVSFAVGQQLDYTGQWIGRDRYVDIPNLVYFSWDTAGRGWDQAPWSTQYSPLTTRTALSDAQYRLTLAGGILDNMWDGSIPGAYAIWDSVFPPGQGPFIFVQDLGGMQMLVGLGDPVNPVDPVTNALFNSGKIVTKPVGVHVRFATLATTPGNFFAWDLNTPGFAGWDQGQWATITP